MATSCTRQLLQEPNSHGVMCFMEKLMDKISSFYNMQYLIDVTFKLSNPTALIPAHRLILSAASPYFEKLFNSDKGIVPVVEINGIDSDTFERLMTFCYTGTMLITLDNVDQLLKAAMILQLDDAVVSCVEYVIENLTDYTLPRAYCLEHDTHCVQLKEKILEYQTKNFMKVIESADFLNISAEKLQEIIENDNLNVSCEEDVYKAVKRWYEHDVSARQQKLPDLIGCLRLTQFDTEFLIENIQLLPGCELLTFKAMFWIREPSRRTMISLRFTNPRKILNEKLKHDTCLLEASINFFYTSYVSSYFLTICQYDKAKDEWTNYSRKESRFTPAECDVVLVDDHLIVIGSIKVSNEIKCCNLKSGTWKVCPSMNDSRYAPSIATLNGKVYAIGGSTGHQTYANSIEMYSVGYGWKIVGSMSTPRAGAGAVALNGEIYVMGGRNGKGDLKSVESYNPASDTWNRYADMNKVHYKPSVAVHNGHIYILGDLSNNCRAAERYDPQTNKWTMICNVIPEFGGTGGISIGDQLWTFGGIDSKSVSVYDPECDVWAEKKPLPECGKRFCFIVPRTLLQNE